MRWQIQQNTGLLHSRKSYFPNPIILCITQWSFGSHRILTSWLILVPYIILSEFFSMKLQKQQKFNKSKIGTFATFCEVTSISHDLRQQMALWIGHGIWKWTSVSKTLNIMLNAAMSLSLLERSNGIILA